MNVGAHRRQKRIYSCDSCVTSHYFTIFIFLPQVFCPDCKLTLFISIFFQPSLPSPPLPCYPSLFNGSSLWSDSHTAFVASLCLNLPFLHFSACFSCNKLHTTSLLFYFSDSKQNTTRKKDRKKHTQANLFKVNLFCCLSWSPFKKYLEYIMHLNLNLSMRKRYEEWSMW